MTHPIKLTENSAPFLAYLEEWYAALPSMPLADLIGDTPQRVALISVDMVNGFCKEGPLAGERVGALSQPVADFFQQAHSRGVSAMALTQDTHDPNTPEFNAYPPHCIAGTSESDTIDELKNLPFFAQVTVIQKNSLSSFINTTFDDWIDARPKLDTFIVVGDCSDLCIYTTAMHLRLVANAHNLQRRVIVPASLVDTFDTPVSVAREAGIPAHAADLHHVLFLHHMAMNGVEIVGALT